MLNTLVQIFGLIGLGALWAFLRPAGLETETVRRVLTNTVYYLFLPALVISILWKAPLGVDSVRISLSATIAILASLLTAWLICRSCKSQPGVTGAMMLAAAFPNATYMGLPLLENTFGPWARSIVIQFDMFACFPLVLTVGMLIANHFGSQRSAEHPLKVLFKIVPLWAAVIGVVLNLSHTPYPDWLKPLLDTLASAVIPLMLFSVGLALHRGLLVWRNLPYVIPVVMIQMFLMPLLVWGSAHYLGLRGDVLRAVVLEGALPSMALGIVISDRYGLNTGIYAAALLLTTVVSIFTLPLWYGWV